jgi:hypothetical protein
MKNKLSFAVTGVIAMLLSACGMAVVPGSGKVVSEARDVGGYSQVVFSAPGELTIVQNGEEGLVIETDDNFLQYIKTSVRGDALYIYVEPDVINLYPSRSIQYTLDADTLTHVILNGSGDIRAGGLIASNLDFDLNGSGDILVGDVKSQTTALDLDGSGELRFSSLMTGQFAVSLDGSGDIAMKEVVAKTANFEIDGSGSLVMTDIIANTLNMKVNGSGDSMLSGEVSHQAIAIHGSGSYDARNLQSQETSIKIIGSGDSKVWVTEDLGITITGSGDVTYWGEPAVTKTVTGSGDISAR